MTDREKVDAKRNEIVQSILGYIEQHPTNWLSGWVSLGVPQNGLTNSNYRGLNALYLWLIGKQQGYTDNRWVTFNQAKELGASIKKGEKSSPILFYTLYDKNTKQEYTKKTTAEMTDEERKQYEDENVRPVVRYSQVFNAQQCVNFPERATTSLMSDEERQKHSNEVVERIIANSEAPVLYDGGNRAFYRITTDNIHLPAIEQFNTMQDYYATALHEIAHSTGHPSRLNRKMGGDDRENYAIEELRAEMAAVFMQMENGIQLEGKHYENHSAYLASWLEEVKNDTKIFTSAVSDAMKISDYVTEHYVKELSADNEQANVATEESTKEKAAIATRYAILDAAMKVANEDMSSVDAKYIDPYLDGHSSERSRLKKQVEVDGVAPSLDSSLVQSVLDEFANPLAISYYGWEIDDVKRAIAGKIEDPALKEYITKLVYNYDSLQDNTPVSESNPMLTVEAQQHYYYTGSSTIRNQQDGFTILHDRQSDKWYLWNSDFIEGKVITSTGSRERLTIGKEAKRSEIVSTFDDGEQFLTAFDNVEQAREYWQKESARIVSLREQYRELNEQGIKRQSENDALMKEKSLLFVDSKKENTTAVDSQQEAVVFNRDLPFTAQVDAALNGDLPANSDLLISTQTPFSLRMVGLENRFMLMHRRHVIAAIQPKNERLHTHGLTAEQIKNLPDILQNPTMIFENAGTQNPDRIVIVSNYLDNDGCPIIAAVKPEGDGRFNGERIKPCNFVVTMFGKDNFSNFLQTAIDENRILFWDKEKTQRLYRELSHQLPQGLYNFESDIIIRKANAFVNTQTQNSSRNSEETANNVTQQAVEQPQITVADKQSTEQVAATVADVAALKTGRPVVKLRMTEAEANVFAEFVTARNDSGMGEKQVIDMGVDRPQSKDFWIGLSYLGKVKQSGTSFSVEFDRSKEYIPFEFEDVPTKNNEETANNPTTNPSSTPTVATEVNAQKKNPSGQAATSTSSSQKWQRVTIPADCIGNEYGARTMVSIPKTSGYTGFAMFVPTKMLQKQDNGTYALLYNSTKKDFLKATNDGREVIFDGETLDKVMRGEKVPYQAKRVRASREAQKMVEQTLANIPSEMQEMQRWCVHQKYFEKNAEGKTQVKKRIFDVNRIEEQSDNFAKCNDSSTWASIDAATSAIKTSKKSLTGLTFVIGEGISVIDLDHCFDSAGNPSALAADLMSAFEGTTYMEKSMSGTGLHIFVKGDLRNAGKFGKVNKGDFGDIEVYDESKFMSVTGNIIGDVRTLGNVTALQQAAVQKYLKANEMAQKKTTTTQKRSQFSTGFVSDDDVIAKIRASKRGAEFDSLYAGNKKMGAKGEPDWSLSDYALINIVAFFTPNQDRNQIQRIFEHSALYRPQKGEKYINRTIDSVLSKLKNPTNIWNNHSASSATKPKTGDTK